MALNDLREWISKLEKEKELARIKVEVDWNLEIGGIARKNMDTGGPALLFGNIKDCKNTICKRFFTCSLSTYARIALMMGLSKDTPYRDIVQVWRERVKKPIKPVAVSNSPCKQNLLRGGDIDPFQFPTPYWEKSDGGRYLGTSHGVVSKDPETGWTNVGVYRAMIHDRNTTTMSVAQGQHIWFH